MAHEFPHQPTFDFRTGIPDDSLFPHRTWRRLMNQSLRTQDSAAVLYGNPAGYQQLRNAIARHVGVSRGVVASADGCRKSSPKCRNAHSPHVIVVKAGKTFS
jgi:GntR family transcriptional regulator/MocR family aminotransferase